jgi:carbon monoxide dehydrogenase subunit G
MKQDFHETLTLAVPPEAVWRTVSDVPTVLSWISIVERVEEAGEDRYTVVLADRLGPFKLRADLDVRVHERVDGQSIRAGGAGEDRQIGSRLIVDVALDVKSRDGGSELDVSGAYEVTGRPAALGAGSIRKKASTVLAEFFAAARQQTGGAPGP